MYPVSDAFLRTVRSNTRKYFWTGTIVTRDGMTYEFGAKEIVKGSGYISRQCCGNTEIELGTVYAAEMGITLLSDIDRYTLEDALVTLVFHLVLADGSVEDVPMGVFEVSEANRLAKCLELKAYDFMLRFDKSFNGFETVGTAYDFIALCCKRCKVEFANKRAEIDAMPNGGVTLSVYTENDIETCRDVLFYVAQVLGGFFIINREGKLELRKYGKDPVMKVEQRHRFSSSFSDFITRYTAVSSTNKQTQIAEYYALDPGDVLTFAGGQADEGWITCITSIRQKIGGKQSLKCVGKNPRLAQAKSRNDKNISGLLNQIEDNAKTGKIGIHTFTNASAHALAVQNAASLFVDDLTLLVVDLVIVEQVFTDSVVVALDLLLRFFDGGRKHLVLDLLIFRYAEGFENAHQFFGTEESHQIVFQGNVKTGLTRVSLTAGTTAELIVDTAGLMTLGADDL